MCNCKNIDCGSYERQTSMKHNFPTKRAKGGWVCVDTCLVQEIAELWHKGIKTLECCCGHNKRTSYVCVDKKHIKQMEELGYKHQKNPNNLDEIFYPLTKYENN